MAKVEQHVLRDFGKAVRDAKIEKGWTHPDLDEAMQGGIDKSHLSKIENGKSAGISPVTASRIVAALEMDRGWVECFKSGACPPVSTERPPSREETEQRERTAERLLQRVENDKDAPRIAEALLTTLAYEFAAGEFRDLQTAYVGLRKALEAADAIRKRGEMPVGNADTQMNAVFAEVAALNDKGERDEADALLEAEEKRMLADQQALEESMAEARRQMLNQRLDQDRIRNRPDLAAQRLIADLRRQPDRGKLFWAINNLACEWRDRGDRTGDIFELRVALHVARSNWENHKGKRGLEAAALHTLGWCYSRLAQRSTRPRDLELARNAFEAALKKTSKTREPENWAARQNGLGVVLQDMGERAQSADLLRAAELAHRAALEAEAKSAGTPDTAYLWNNLGNAVRTLGEITQDAEPLTEAVEAQTTSLSLIDKQADPLGWELTQNNLGLALRWLGAVNRDGDLLRQAREAYRACENLKSGDDAAFQWAVHQWNIADLALARYDLNPDPALVEEATTHVRAARDVFEEGSEYQTERCDELIAKIEAARANP